MKTANMIAKDLAAYSMLYGKDQPVQGRKATEQEFNQIRQWIREAEHVRFADEHDAPNTDLGRIEMHRIDAKTIRILATGEDKIYFIGPMGLATLAFNATVSYSAYIVY